MLELSGIMDSLLILFMILDFVFILFLLERVYRIYKILANHKECILIIDEDLKKLAEFVDYEE